MKSSRFLFILILVAGSPAHSAPKSEPAAPSTSLDEEFDAPTSRYSVVLPSMVMHGEAPTGGVNTLMPRRVSDDGRFVLTPGLGVEYEGSRSLDLIFAGIKDCYDDYAGTLQIGQYFKWGSRLRFGYTIGVYVRQTPITCYTSTIQTRTGGGGGGGGPILPLPGGRSGGRPTTVNTVTTTQCAFNDNLPLRYTFAAGGDYIDVIPSPFLNLSYAFYKSSSFEVLLKLMSNYYFNEFGLSIPF